MTDDRKDRLDESTSDAPRRSLKALAQRTRDRDHDDDWLKSRDPSDALAEESLAAALPSDVLRKLMRGDPVAVVIAVPAPDWVGPIARAIGALCGDADVIRRDGSSRDHAPTNGGDKIGNALANGMPIIGVSQSPRVYLPSALIGAADASVALGLPDAATLRRILTRCGCRPVPRAIPDAPCAGLSFDEIAAAFRQDATGRDVLDALARMRARKAAPIDDGTPPLDKLPGVSGEARHWAETLARDFALWRSGQIKDFGALDSSAMIYGPPGTGKTMLVHSLARTLGVPLHYTAPGLWFCGPGNGNLGDAAAAYRRSWDAAVADARSGLGAVWMLDEADGLMDRASGGGSGNKDFWANLLSLINVTLSDKVDGLCVVGATNAGSSAAPGSSIDGALRRRFGRTLILGLPTAGDLSEVASYWTCGALSPADLLPVVRLTSGASAADAANWARDAMNLARDAKRAATVEDFIAVATPPDRRPVDVVWRIALHEAAHAVAAQAMGRRVDDATIVETATTDVLTRSTPVGTVATAASVDRSVIVKLAGRAAEETFLGDVSAGAEATSPTLPP